MGGPADDPAAAALTWLLACDEPAVRHLTRRELLGNQDGEAAADRRWLAGTSARAAA